MEEETKECCNCGVSLGLFADEELYEYNGNVYCAKCLLYQLEEERKIDSSTTTYYKLDGECVGDDNDIDEVMERVVEYYEDEIKVIKE